MPEKIKIYLGKERQIVEVELIEVRETTVLVRLADGNIIKRKKATQVVQEEK